MYHPIKILRQPFLFLFRSFETKMEMVPYRALHTLLMLLGITGRRVNQPTSQRGEAARPLGEAPEHLEAS
jgi:hypothetical protein